MADDVQWFLQEWARWAKEGNGLARLKYPSQTPFQRLRGSTVKSANISDPVALEIDAAVSQLVRRDRRLGDAVLLSYLAGRSAAYIGRELGCSTTAAHTMVKVGEGYVSGFLDAGIETTTTATAVGA